VRNGLVSRHAETPEHIARALYHDVCIHE